MTMKQFIAMVTVGMFVVAFVKFVDAPTKANLKTVVVRALPLV